MFVRLIEQVRPLGGLPTWLRYLITTALVFACFAGRAALERTDEPGHLPIYLLFIPAVVVAAFLFNRGSGFFAVALSALVGVYFFIEPRRSFSIEHTGEIIRLIAFVLIGFLIAALVEALRKAVDDLAAGTRELTQRTEELSATRAELMQVSEHRQLLLSDLNHRIKNHLASVAAGISLGRREVQDDRARDTLDAAISRLNVLGDVYAKLHLDGSDVSIDSKEFLESLCSDLQTSLLQLRPIALTWNIESNRLTAQQAVNLGLIINELVTNAVKYAFPDEASGEIHVRYGQDEGSCKLQVIDDGVGAKPGLAGTGTRLVKALAGQMGDRLNGTTRPGRAWWWRFPPARREGPTSDAARQCLDELTASGMGGKWTLNGPLRVCRCQQG